MLYALSTLAQTCAALAAFVGAVGIFRLQVLRERYAALEREVRGWALEATRHDYWLMPMKEVLERIEKSEKEGNTSPYLKSFKEARTRWEAAPDQLARSRDALLIFEAWNLIVILGSLAGFAHVPRLAALSWSGLLCWAVALITVGITGWALVVWIGRYEPVEQNAAANRRATGWRQPFLRTVAWINRQGPWVTAVASIAIAVVSLTLARQSNEGAYRELSRSLLKFTERGGRASYPQFTAAQGIAT